MRMLYLTSIDGLVVLGLCFDVPLSWTLSTQCSCLVELYVVVLFFDDLVVELTLLDVVVGLFH